MTGELLPLFPLRAVLFPGSALPLHIFEERYRVLERLQTVIAHVERVIPLLDRVESIDRIVRNDGYL